MTKELEKNNLLDHSEEIFWSIPEPLPPLRLNGGPLNQSAFTEWFGIVLHCLLEGSQKFKVVSCCRRFILPSDVTGTGACTNTWSILGWPDSVAILKFRRSPVTILSSVLRPTQPCVHDQGNAVGSTWILSFQPMRRRYIMRRRQMTSVRLHYAHSPGRNRFGCSCKQDSICRLRPCVCRKMLNMCSHHNYME